MTDLKLLASDTWFITRMLLVTILAKLAELIVPQDARKTVSWLRKRPMEE